MTEYQKAERIASLISQLSETEKIVYLTRYFEYYSDSEINALLGLGD